MSRTPLERVVNQILRALTAIMILLVLLLMLSGYVQDLPLTASVLAIATAIKALVPEGLVLITTVAFALGALRAATRQVLVQKLNAVEALSHLTTLCFDKTGTLGTNRLIFDKLEILDASEDEVVQELRSFLGAVSDKNQTVLAIEAALPALGTTVLGEEPFSSETKISAVRIRRGSEELSLWLGAPEVLGGGQLTEAQQRKVTDFHRSGHRVLVFGSSAAPLPRRDKIRLLAIVILHDELRPEAGEAILFFAARGIALKVLSGDHPETVAVLAREAGMSVIGPLLNGPDLATMTPEAFAETACHGQVFGRLLPAPLSAWSGMV